MRVDTSLMAEVCFLMLAFLSASGRRSAYAAYVVLGMLYIPATAGFRFTPQPCDVSFSLALVLHSLSNVGHIWRFAVVFIASHGQFERRPIGWAKAALCTLAMGAMLEGEQGLVGRGHCRIRDLVSDIAGLVVGAALVLLWRMRSQAGGSAYDYHDSPSIR